jgi:hypothetical protein
MKPLGQILQPGGLMAETQAEQGRERNGARQKRFGFVLAINRLIRADESRFDSQTINFIQTLCSGVGLCR